MAICVWEPAYNQESQGERRINLSVENCASTAVLGQILNQSIISVHGFYKEKVALSFMGNIPEQMECVCIILLFQWRG